MPWLEAQWAEPAIRAAVFAFALTAIFTLVRYLVTPRGRIAWAISHEHMFLLPTQPNQSLSVHTRELWIQNIGRATAEGVEVILNHPPQHFELWPVIPHTTATAAAPARLAITIGRLSRREFVTISLFEARPGFELPSVLNVRWSNGVARQVQMTPQQAFARWQYEIRRALVLAGIIGVIYVAIRLLQLVVG